MRRKSKSGFWSNKVSARSSLFPAEPRYKAEIDCPYPKLCCRDTFQLMTYGTFKRGSKAMNGRLPVFGAATSGNGELKIDPPETNGIEFAKMSPERSPPRS